jgi:hypothetical protein
MPPKTFDCRTCAARNNWEFKTVVVHDPMTRNTFKILGNEPTTSYRLDLEPLLIEKQESVYIRRWVKQMMSSNQIKDSRLSRLILRHFFIWTKPSVILREHIFVYKLNVLVFHLFHWVSVFVPFFFVCFISSNRRYPSLHRHRMLSILRSAQRNIRFWNGERERGGDYNKIDSSSTGRTMYTIENDLTVVEGPWEREI